MGEEKRGECEFVCVWVGKRESACVGGWGRGRVCVWVGGEEGECVCVEGE